MQPIGVIGLGDIAAKAYLPLITTRPVEIHLCTRNEQVLTAAGKRYRITNLHQSIESLLASGIRGAFVHTSTASHEAIVQTLLENNVHVYVDKPVTYHYDSTARLFDLAWRNNLHLQVGFNRRTAPAYHNLKAISDVNMIVLQKNRVSLPGDIRAFVFDDFIHVVDTLLWLFNKPHEKLIVQGRKKGNQLYHVTIQLIAGDGTTAIGIMNRDSGTVEERLEVFSPTGKHVVTNLVDASNSQDHTETRLSLDDWESTLHKRGFDHLIDHFISSLDQTTPDGTLTASVLRTHEVCEQIVGQLDR